MEKKWWQKFLGKRRRIEGGCFFQTREAATMYAEEMRKLGYDVKITRDKSKKWGQGYTVWIQKQK